MATYADIRDAIEARLNTVANIGNVQDYRRVAQTYSQLDAAFTATIGGVKQIRGHSIAWESATWEPEGWQSAAQMRMTGDEVFVVRSYMSANDGQATDRTFSALVESMMSALVTCAASLTPRASHVPVTLRQNGFATFDVPGIGEAAIIHYAEIAVTVPNQRVV
ncbi:MAG: hypothetical protein NAOJABEB_02974 [Steroidobacteraceae bacterium]|nr:hypothetical protein [Steroidobacteraceae bacterium]